ncbi:hypothetical protein BG011_010090 [Mortierella polycephala]|uniref:Protein kinase domain-containing protein n=1 Tax=Mortierella polycephala TaxID=41804 RepID=A0A9P6TVN6_9FUNG|nr:hypothetical protein BG011_010090 [Mortierella polycephala]
MEESEHSNIEKDVIWEGQRVTIKTPKDEVSFLREVNIIKDLADRHIIQFYHYAVEGELKLIMEHAEDGDLKEALPKLQWEDKVRITGEIAHGLCYIHSLGIIHCDIKSSNVFLTKNLVAKLGDFGSAMAIKDKKNNTECLGTRGWMAPETLEDTTAYSPESDIFSLGIIMWEMASGNTPENRSQVLEEKLDNVPLEFHSIMRACLDQDPKRRPNAREISILKSGRFMKEVDTYANDEDNTSCRSDAAIVPQEPFDERWDTTEREKVGMILQYYKSELFDQARELARQLSLHWEACCILGEIYRNNQGVDKNDGEARIWMGVGCFRAGNHAKALEWYRKSAEGGYSEGRYKMGVMFYYGHGMPEKDLNEAICCMHKAVEQGNRSAITGLGIIAMGQEKYAEAMKRFLEVDDDRISQYHIGYMYYTGSGVPRDYITATQWFKKAAGDEYGLAEHAMGAIHNYGRGTQVDLKEAKKWYLRALEHGQGFVANELGLAMITMGREIRIQGYGYIEDASKEGDLLARANLLLRYI